ncbi:MAG: hypothetical protein WDW38_001976 [Sanguina aurantia]
MLIRDCLCAGDKNPGSGDPKGGKDDGKAGSSGGGGMDWDDAWSSFQKQVNKNVERDPQQTTNSPPRASQGPPRRASSPKLSPASRDVRDNERLMLDFFVNENFSKFGALGAVLLIVLFLSVGGGAPPTDDRCTLPWC